MLSYCLRTHKPFSRSAISFLPPQRWKQTASDTPDPHRPIASSSQDAAPHGVEEKSPPSLTFLSRPLGVERRPSASFPSWEEKKAELLDYDKHLEKRRHLIKEATSGYFKDFHKLKHHGGKTWVAPNVLIREDKALYFPDITGVSLTPQETVHTTTLCEGRISIISVLSTTMSEENAKSFTEPALERYQSHPLFRFVQINLQENPLKGFLVSLFLSSIRSRTPTNLQSTYLVSRQNMEFLREPLGMVNKHIGYVYLVDEQFKIRWGGCGFATGAETEALTTCTRVLLRRLEKRSAGEASTAGPALSDIDSAEQYSVS